MEEGVRDDVQVSSGRCAGCGKVGTLAEVSEHTRDCRDFRLLFTEDPDRALHPADEFERWAAEDRPAQRAGARQAKVTEADRRRAEQAERWRTPADILED